MKDIRISINFSVNILFMIFFMVVEILIFTDIFHLKITKRNLSNSKVVNASVVSDDKISKKINIENFNNSNSINTTANKVMFVAHPDDETMWGSSALYHDKYIVVCITCGVDEERVREFENVMNKFGDDYVMLSYPDLVNGKKSDWQEEWVNLNYDINKIISEKEWDIVVTHNPEGEYGHIHHRLLSSIVTSHSNTDKLLYFGRFYWNEIPEDEKLYSLSEEDYKFKTEEILPLYKTQYKAINILSNMIHYENWVYYDDWYRIK